MIPLVPFEYNTKVNARSSLHRAHDADVQSLRAVYLSLPLFERFGFQQTDSEQADRYGVTFERSLVERVATGPV